MPERVRADSDSEGGAESVGVFGLARRFASRVRKKYRPAAAAALGYGMDVMLWYVDHHGSCDAAAVRLYSLRSLDILHHCVCSVKREWE